LPANVSRVLADLTRAFAAFGRRWYVFGAQAVAAAGVPRFTADIDVTVEAAPNELVRLLAALRPHGIVAREHDGLARFVAETRVVPAVHSASRFPIDIVLAGPGLEEEMLARVRLRRVGRVRVPFIDTADLVALKILARRPKDLEDVRAILRVAPEDLDVSTARARIARLGELLEDSTLLESFDAIVSGATAPPARASVRDRQKRKPPPRREGGTPKRKSATAQKKKTARNR
jgi:hypothetical protein